MVIPVDEVSRGAMGKATDEHGWRRMNTDKRNKRMCLEIRRTNWVRLVEGEALTPGPSPMALMGEGGVEHERRGRNEWRERGRPEARRTDGFVWWKGGEALTPDPSPMALMGEGGVEHERRGGDEWREGGWSEARRTDGFVW
jgi:hypothetical protein